MDAEQSTLQLVTDQLEELIVTLIEEIRERPGVAAAILAAVIGVVIGSVLAARMRRGHKRARAPRQVRRAGDAAALAGLGWRLLENPLVRAAVMAQVKRRFTG